ncbi:MAG: hypothetical protein ACF787_13410 [Rhodopirellula sp. JB053]
MDSNPNRAPWTSPGGAADPANAGDPYAPHEAANQPPAKKGLGCWVWGCLGAVVFMLLAMVGIAFGTYFFVTKQVAKYTDTQPAEMPVVELEDEELTALEQRIESFTNQVRGDQGTDGAAGVDTGDSEGAEQSDAEPDTTEEPPMQELQLSSEEINGLIGARPELKGRVFLDIDDGRVFGKVSIPTDMIPGGGGRFFNADGEFDVSMSDGILVVRLIDASVKGERIPQQILDQFSQENLAKDVYNDPEHAEILRKFESIEVVDDSIVLRLREPATKSQADDSPQSSAAEDEVEPAASGV